MHVRLHTTLASLGGGESHACVRGIFVGRTFAKGAPYLGLSSFVTRFEHVRHSHVTTSPQQEGERE